MTKAAAMASDPALEPALENQREINLERFIDAPRAIVWRAFAEPGQVEQWWGPTGFTTTTHARDFRTGGEWIFTMHGPDGRDYENHVIFDEIIEGERVAYRHSGGDESEPISFRAELNFFTQGSGTLVRLRSRFPTREARDYVIREHGALEGGRQTLARLAARAAELAKAG